jgi:hypothetical protein
MDLDYKDYISRKSFIEQTAKDYDLDYDVVNHIYVLYWPERFYKKLEEIIENGGYIHA